MRRQDADQAPVMKMDFWRTDQMPEALASKEMSLVVRAYRHHPAHGRRPLPQVDMARWLGITQGQLSRIESGRNRIRDLDKLIHYAHCLRIPASLLWFDLDASAGRNSDVAPGRTVVPQRHQESSIPPLATSMEATIADSLLATLNEYSLMDNLVGSHSMLDICVRQTNFIQKMLPDAKTADRSRLLYVGARFAEFAGWVHQDSGDLSKALYWTNIALELAQESSDIHMVSYIQMRKSNIASDVRKPELVIALAQAALQDAELLTPKLRAVALRQEAFGYALAGDVDKCARTLDQAFQRAEGALEIPGELADYCTLSYIEMEAANCWVELGKPVKAIATLEQGLSEWSPQFRRDLGLCLARLAVAHAGIGHSDQSVAAAKQALTIAAQTRSQRIAYQLRRATRMLADTGAREQAQALHRSLSSALV
jgi:transcriptional regulator with XRE-family HTH domain